jgi:hypothetical protein
MNELAACLHADPELFFDGDRTCEAIRVCMGCPVWAECTLANVGEQWGVWGCSERARRRMRKLRREGASDGELLALAHQSNLRHVPGLHVGAIDPAVFARSTSYVDTVS